MEVASIDQLIESFDPKADYSPKAPESSYITIRLPVESKQRYEQLQTMTNNKFGKLLKSVITKTIDSVDIE